MGFTQKTLDKLPENIRSHIEGLKCCYNHPDLIKDDIRLASGSYCLALYHVGLVTETEKRLLHTYITL